MIFIYLKSCHAISAFSASSSHGECWINEIASSEWLIIFFVLGELAYKEIKQVNSLYKSTIGLNIVINFCLLPWRCFVQDFYGCNLM
jgi:hypothetical protein